MTEQRPRLTVVTIIRVGLLIFGIFLCYRLGTDSARTGLARLYSTMAIVGSSLPSADNAVRLAPTDPEAHYTRGLTLVNLQRLDEAIAELREAVNLRPHHYYQWLDLGVTLDRSDDTTGAIAAFNHAIQLAPSFAQPHWQFGNLLFREGRYDEAFPQLRLGIQSNPALFESMMQLAWSVSSEDVAKFEQLVEPKSREDRLRLARFLAKRGEGSAAAGEVQRAGQPETRFEFKLVQETITQLLSAKDLTNAYVAWVASHSAAKAQSGQLINGDFVDPIRQEDPGFGWQLLGITDVSASIDSTGPTPNTRSIRFDFRGDTPPGALILSQMVLVQRNTRYSLTFMAKTSELVSAGPPVVNVLTGGSQPVRILGRSEGAILGVDSWRPYRIEFATDEKTSAIVVALQRAPCDQNPCQIFGRLWLGAFALSPI